MRAVIRIAVPLAESQLNKNTAGSAVGLATTGATRITSLSSPGIGRLGAEMWLRTPFSCGVPQAKTITVRMIHGTIATRNGTLSPAAAGMAVAEASLTADVRPRQRRKSDNETIEHAAATMSTSHGP